MEINKVGITNADVSSATVQFDVKQEWLANNSLTTADVKLFRWTGQWDELATTYVSSFNSSAKFEAVTPGFSTFAVGSSSGAPTAVPATTTPETQEVPTTPESTETTADESSTEEVQVTEEPRTTDQTEEAQAEKSGGATTTILIVGLVIVAMIIAAIMMQKKKQQQ